MTNEDFVTYEQAVRLKALGFDDAEALGCYVTHKALGGISLSQKGVVSYCEEYVCSAPTLSQAAKWLREVHHMHPHVELIYENDVPKWRWGLVTTRYNGGLRWHPDRCETYEEALSKGIAECLEIACIVEGLKTDAEEGGGLCL